MDVSAQSYRFFTDGDRGDAARLHRPVGRPDVELHVVAVGAIFYQTPPSPFTIWFDDLAIDDSQIGCQ